MKKELNLRFPIPREIVLNSNQPLAHRVKALRVKALREMAESLGGTLSEAPFDFFTIDVYVYPPSNRRIDPPNLYPTAKPLIDGLTDANLWEDDDYSHLYRTSFYYGGRSGCPDLFLLELKVKEIERK